MRHLERALALRILQDGLHLPLDGRREILDACRPGMRTTGAGQCHDRQASDDELTPEVVTLRTDDGEWPIGIRHGSQPHAAIGLMKLLARRQRVRQFRKSIEEGSS